MATRRSSAIVAGALLAPTLAASEAPSILIRPAGIDAAVGVDPAIPVTDATGRRRASTPAIAFHELAEAKAKVERGITRDDGAHQEEIDREATLLSQPGRGAFTAYPAGSPDLREEKRP
jgi:hypothetical protein